jgi:BON domain
MHARTVLHVSVALMCGCAATATAASPHEGDPTLEDLRVTAASDGTLTLSGQASSKEAAQRTIEIARSSAGVKRVQSNLTIVRHTKR